MNQNQRPWVLRCGSKSSVTLCCTGIGCDSTKLPGEGMRTHGGLAEAVVTATSR
jgi:hypothetical protein